jgi:ABC-type polysaccharide/polyol phosphate export permease
MAIAYFIKKQQTSILLSTFVALALFLFSDVIFPPEVMPKLAAFLAELNPMVVGERMIRKVIYHKISLGIQMSDIWILIGFVAFAVILVIIAARKNKRRS